MGTIEDIINAIVRQEDPNNPKAVHARMLAQFGKHNPGHLVFAGQRGAVPITLSTGGRAWAGWNSWQAGIQGIRNQIRLDARRGHTLESFIHKYAPASENPTSAYVRNVESWTGIPRYTPLAQVADPLGGLQAAGRVRVGVSPAGRTWMWTRLTAVEAGASLRTHTRAHSGSRTWKSPRYPPWPPLELASSSWLC